jgi:cell division protein FtsL
MTDWADGIETRNFGIKRKVDRGVFSDLVRSILFLALVAGTLIFCSWVRHQIVSTGYESQVLFAEEESLLRIQKRLILEEETLKSPERIDIIARNDLGMAPLRPAQLLRPWSQDREPGLTDAMAMVDSKAVDLKKTGQGKRSGDYSN